MAKARKYTEQFSFVGTSTAYDLMVAVAERIEIDKAPIVRTAVDQMFGLVDGELRPGDTFESAIQRITNLLDPVITATEPEQIAV